MTAARRDALMLVLFLASAAFLEWLRWSFPA